jgi:hypothetical protein
MSRHVGMRAERTTPEEKARSVAYSRVHSQMCGVLNSRGADIWTDRRPGIMGAPSLKSLPNSPGDRWIARLLAACSSSRPWFSACLSSEWKQAVGQCSRPVQKHALPNVQRHAQGVLALRALTGVVLPPPPIGAPSASSVMTSSDVTRKISFDGSTKSRSRTEKGGWQSAADHGTARNLSATAACVPVGRRAERPRSCRRCASGPAS